MIAFYCKLSWAGFWHWWGLGKSLNEWINKTLPSYHFMNWKSVCHIRSKNEMKYGARSLPLKVMMTTSIESFKRGLNCHGGGVYQWLLANKGWTDGPSPQWGCLWIPGAGGRTLLPSCLVRVASQEYETGSWIFLSLIQQGSSKVLKNMGASTWLFTWQTRLLKPFARNGQRAFIAYACEAED